MPPVNPSGWFYRCLFRVMAGGWLVICLTATVWLFRHEGLTGYSAMFCLLMFTALFLPGLFSQVFFRLCPAGFVARRGARQTTIHLHIRALARCRTRKEVIAHKQDLHRCIHDAMQRGEVVVLASHLLTVQRTKEIYAYLSAAGITFTAHLQHRATPRLEKFLLTATYLLSEQRYVRVRPSGLSLTLTPLS